jgi:hypothetical protein
MYVILVSEGCNELAQTGWLKTTKFIFSKFRRPEI